MDIVHVDTLASGPVRTSCAHVSVVAVLVVLVLGLVIDMKPDIAVGIDLN